MTQEEMIALAKVSASTYGLAWDLICGIVEQESSWNPYALRYEPKFFSTYIAPMWTSQKLTDITEAYARAFSWGLMQTMGEVAREFGFGGPLPSLCDPATGLNIGCQIFARKLVLAGGNVPAALLAWNGGGNSAYPDQVLSKMQQYKT